MLEVASRRARLEMPGLDVRVDRGAVLDVQHVVALTTGALLLVVAANASENEEQCPSRPTANQLAVQARCPVVALSPTARTRIDSQHHNVVVGWPCERAAHHVLDVAADQAVSRTARLTVVTVLPGAGETGGHTRRRADLESALVEAVAEVERRRPGLVIDLLHPSGSVVGELCKAARQADLLVIGCDQGWQGWRDRQDPVAEVVATMSPAPALLVPGSARTRPDQLGRRVEPVLDPVTEDCVDRL